MNCLFFIFFVQILLPPKYEDVVGPSSGVLGCDPEEPDNSSLPPTYSEVIGDEPSPDEELSRQNTASANQS